MHRHLTSVVLASAMIGLGCQAEKNAVDVTLKETTMADLDKSIAGHKGKVIIIDIWFIG